MKTYLKYLLANIILLMIVGQVWAYDKSDSLMGSLNTYRNCYDVTYYNLDIKLNIPDQSIVGKNIIQLKAVRDF